MKCLIIFCSFVILVSSCSTNKIILKGQKVYAFSLGNDPAGPRPAYTEYKVAKRKHVKVVDNGTYLIIKDDPTTDAATYIPNPAKTNIVLSPVANTVWKNESIGSLYFYEPTDLTAKKSFWYRDGKFVLQAATIPIKIRPAIKRAELLDSFPSQAETGVNIGFLSGYKFAWNRFRQATNVFGKTTDQYSITPGLLLNLGTADLSAAATRPVIQFPRKEPMLTFGGSILFGFNNINIGYAFAWDQALGPHSSTWLYQGRMWNGIILTLDLLK